MPTLGHTVKQQCPSNQVQLQQGSVLPFGCKSVCVRAKDTGDVLHMLRLMGWQASTSFTAMALYNCIRDLCAQGLISRSSLIAFSLFTRGSLLKPYTAVAAVHHSLCSCT